MSHRRTGPRTAAGKAAVSLNRTTHGLWSRGGYEMQRYLSALTTALRRLQVAEPGYSVTMQEPVKQRTADSESEGR